MTECALFSSAWNCTNCFNSIFINSESCRNNAENSVRYFRNLNGTVCRLKSRFFYWLGKLKRKKERHYTRGPTYPNVINQERIFLISHLTSAHAGFVNSLHLVFFMRFFGQVEIFALAVSSTSEVSLGSCGPIGRTYTLDLYLINRGSVS